MNTKNLKTKTDEQLAQLLQSGYSNAMGELYNRYFMLVFSKCLSFAKNTDDASDMAQDIMLKVMEKIGSFKGDSKFSTWLYAITFNHCADRTRKSKAKYFTSFDYQYEFIDNSTNDKESAVEVSAKEERAEKALSSIPEEDQQLLLMKYQLNKSIQELQRIYNVSASAIKMRLSRARTKATVVYNMTSILQVA